VGGGGGGWVGGGGEVDGGWEGVSSSGGGWPGWRWGRRGEGKLGNGGVGWGRLETWWGVEMGGG